MRINFTLEEIEKDYGVVVGVQQGTSAKTGKPYKKYSIVFNTLDQTKGTGFTCETVYDNCEKDFHICLGDVLTIFYKMNGTFKQGIGMVDIVGNIFADDKPKK